ncbi:cobalt-precorrin-6A reductase [Seohaeicola zhoushanensis]|uniref:Precorrin-6A reductase n=1 Tax=Seohaeicola zhoushanensis TaxID=1569283 RepID=A0A8J3GWI7_9RHOB|nr:cobalt-precorrin-6A reductase [Seohaeicola zhoushanensis]GHF43188.1 precorrin-6A reductase [Seohaeicola zhoushanensis]
MTLNLLVLGGTTEATALAKTLAENDIPATFSYAGRTEAPQGQPLPVRVGGFGGARGLADWITENRITHVIDATHPFAAQMSANAINACEEAGVPLAALTRPAWQAQPGDRWIHVPDIPAAVEALGERAQRVMLAIGRMHLDVFAAAPWHFYLLRLVDAPKATLPLPDCAVEVSRGPFTVEGDIALMERHRISVVVSKNAGGNGARAKLDAARALDLPVVMIDRPALPKRHEVHTVKAALDWVHAGTERGV